MTLVCCNCGEEVAGVEGGACGQDGGLLMDPAELTKRPEDPLLGRLVADKYAVVGFIGKGGFGQVYRAIQRPVGRAVALKVQGEQHAGDVTLRARFFREAKIIGQLNHPAAVHLYDYGEHEGRLFMAMELVRGHELAAVLNTEGALAPRRVVSIARQILAALGEAHGLGLIHRDLKPDNIMLVRDEEGEERVKVLDFGIAKVLEEELSEESITSGTVILGTPAYLSPEQARGEDLGPESDLYSLGVTLYEMLCGQRPFHAPTPVGLVTAHLTAPIPDLDEGVPDALASVVRRALAKSRASRYPDARSMSTALSGTLPMGATPLPGILGPVEALDTHAPTEALEAPPTILAADPLPTLATEMEVTLQKPGPRWFLILLFVAAAAALTWRLLPDPPPPPSPTIWRLDPARLPLDKTTVRASGPVQVVLAKGDHLLATVSDNRRIDLWGVGAGGWAGTLSEAKPEATAVAMAPDLSGFAWAEVMPDHTHTVFVQVPGGERRAWKGHHYRIDRLLFSPTGERLVMQTRKGKLKLWRPANPEGKDLKAHDKPTALAFSGDGQVLAAGYEDGTVQLWAGGPVKLKTLEEPVRFLAVDARGAQVLAVGKTSMRLSEGELRPLAHEVKVVEVDPEASKAILGDVAGGVTLVDLKSGAGERIPRHGSAVGAVALRGDRAVSASGGEVCAWNTATGAASVATVHDYAIHQLVLPEDPSWFVTAAADWTARVVAVDRASWIETAGPQVLVRDGEIEVDGDYLADWPPRSLKQEKLQKALDRQLVATVGLRGRFGPSRTLLGALRKAGVTQVQPASPDGRQRMPKLQLRAVDEAQVGGGTRLLLHLSTSSEGIVLQGALRVGEETIRLKGDEGCAIARLPKRRDTLVQRRKALRALLAFRTVDAGGLRTLRAPEVSLRASEGVRWPAVVGVAASAADLVGERVTLELGAPTLDPMDCPNALTAADLAASLRSP